MTELPHVFAVAEGSWEGRDWTGLASEGLPPKWFTKDPGTRFEEDLPVMLESLEHAAGTLCSVGYDSVFEAWWDLYKRQEGWGRTAGVPPLLAHLGTALMERAMIDGFCRGAGLSFREALRSNAFGIDLGRIHHELAGTQPADWLPDPPSSIVARHTIGLGDPLRGADVPSGDQLEDGLPHVLSDVIHRYGLTHFKIKLCGDLAVDVPRLVSVAEVLSRDAPGFRYTLDGNEQYRDITTFRDHWEIYQTHPGLSPLFEEGRLLFVEQPLHREVALAETVRNELTDWGPEAPPMIIDESDGELSSLRQAIVLGYRGTSHKNCKGVIKGIANRCLIEWHRRQSSSARPWLMSGEDLANVGPVALLNDLTVMAALGIDDVERNGHHYFAGLSMFSDELQACVRAKHPDLYEMSEEGVAVLKIEQGQIAINSLEDTPFGHGLELSPRVLDLLGEEGLPSLA